MSLNILGGSVMLDAERCALHRFVHSCLVDDPMETNERIAFARYASQAFYSKPRAEGQRVWFRKTFFRSDSSGKKHEETTFTSLNPGGFRYSPPNEVGDVIEDLGPIPKGLGIFEDLRSLIKQTLASPALNSDTKHLCELASSILDGSISAKFSDSRKQFREVAEQLRTGKRIDLASIIKHLYENIFFKLELPNTEFSDAFLLLQVQAGPNMWALEDLFQFPRDGLNAFLEQLRESSGLPDASPGFREFAQALLHDGSKRLKDALASWSLIEFQNRLYEATHYFWCAQRLAAKATRSLGYEALVAEESFCCCVSGLTIGDRFYWQEPLATAKQLVAEITQDVAQSEYRLVQKYASSRVPAMPRFLFDLFFAYALVLKSPAMAPEGLKRFQQIEQEAGLTMPGYDMPDNWIDLIALNAARHLGDQAEIVRRAVRLAGRLAVAKSVPRSAIF